MGTTDDIQLAGQIDWRNHNRLGYERLTHGVYGKTRDTDRMTTWDAQRANFLAHTKAVTMAYRGRQVALYGPTALQVLRVALPVSMQDWTNCHLLVPTGTHRPERKAVVAHHTKTEMHIWTVKDGLPVLHPVDHWLQMRGTDDELIEVADGLIRRQHPLITMDDFRRRLGELAGTSGARRGRRLLTWVVPGTDSLYETKTRLILVRAGLPTPAVNFPVPCRSGFTYPVDMGYPREKIAVEYDGAVHVGNTIQMENDAARRRDLQDEGWLVTTVTAKQLKAPTQLVHSVEEALVLRRAALRANR